MTSIWMDSGLHKVGQGALDSHPDGIIWIYYDV